MNTHVNRGTKGTKGTKVYPKISTITVDRIIPEATNAVQRFIKGSSVYRTLPYFGSHITLDDLVMEAVEKVIRANPRYLTKSYVWVAARCVCIVKLQQKKLAWATSDKVNPTLGDSEDGPKVSLEELLEGDSYDHIEDTFDNFRSYLDTSQLELLEGLLKGHMYVEIAEDLGISLRTLERQVQELKWMLEYIVTGIDPDTNEHSLLFSN